MRMIYAFPLLLVAACGVQSDPQNDQLTVTYDENTLEDLGNAAETAGEAIGNAAGSAGDAISNEVGDIDIDVDRNADANAAGNAT